MTLHLLSKFIGTPLVTSNLAHAATVIRCNLSGSSL